MKRFRLFVLFLVAVLSTNYLYCAENIDTVWMRFTHNIASLQFSHDDSKIYTVGSGGIIIFDTQSGEQIKQFNPYNGIVAEYNSDESLIVLAHESPDSLNNVFPFVEVYRADTYEHLKTIKLPQVPLQGTTQIHLSPDGKTIAVTNALGIYFVDYESGTIMKNIAKFENDKVVTAVYSVFSKDNQDLIFTGSDGKLRFINTQTYEIDYRYDAGYGLLAISEDGSMIAFKTGKSGKAVEIMNTNTHEIIGFIPGTAGWVTSFAFSVDGKYIAVSDLDYATSIYQVSGLSLIQKLTPGRAFTTMNISKNNQYLVGGVGAIIELINLKVSDVTNEQTFKDVLFPNPTNGSVSISFYIDIPSKLQFNLYDQTGRFISTLADKFFNEGNNTEDVQLTNLANGSYLLKIESPQFNKTFQVIIQK